MQQMPPSIKLIVGLGNPGLQYALTPHNIGFIFLDALSMTLNGSSPQSKFQGIINEIQLQNQSIKLLKPQTYMNLSGQSVQTCSQYYKINPDEILVVHDDADLDLFTVKIKQGGGHGGHNGLKSIDQHVGPNYWRLRLGIGRSVHGSLSNYVLSPFKKQDQQILPDYLSVLIENLYVLLTKGPTPFMNDLQKALAFLKI